MEVNSICHRIYLFTILILLSRAGTGFSGAAAAFSFASRLREARFIVPLLWIGGIFESAAASLVTIVIK